MHEFKRGALAAGLFLSIFPSPVLSQPFTEDEEGRRVMASYDYKELPPIKTNQGMASVLVERYCSEDASGRIEISLYAGDFDPKKGPVWVEAHPLNADGGTLVEVRESAEVKSPIEKAVITIPKETRFMIQIKEKVANLTTILKEFDVVHYCRERLIPFPVEYARSPEGEEEN